MRPSGFIAIDMPFNSQFRVFKTVSGVDKPIRGAQLGALELD